MFLNYIKDFSVKKRLKISLQNVKSALAANSVKTVGLLIDESHFRETKALIKGLTEEGILEENIEVIIYRDKLRKSRDNTKPAFNAKHLKWNATINNSAVNNFIDKEFDLLISYYDVEKAILLIVTHDSKAYFKVGFAAVDKRLNDLMINTNVENHKVFIHELFRYLKILNKI
jgi:hypothetical protein